MSTWTAPVGQSFSHGMQYQHSSKFMQAVPLLRAIANTSSGHTATPAVRPLWAMPLSASPVTGTLVGLKAGGLLSCMNGSSGSKGRVGVVGAADPQGLVRRAIAVVDGHDVAVAGALEAHH